MGGTFDPAHKGHLEISKQAKKILELKNIIWAVTKQNPFKNTSKTNLKNRIKFAKKFIGKNNFIKVKFYEEKVLSNKTIDLINYLDKDKKFEIYFIMGADTHMLLPHQAQLHLLFAVSIASASLAPSTTG